MLNDLRLYICNFIVAFIPFHGVRLLYYKIVMRFKIGKGSSIHLGCQFNAAGNFELGSNSTVNQFCRLDNRGGIHIGNNVSLSPYVKLMTADHDVNHPSCAGRNRAIVIEDFVFIGADAMVLGGVVMKKGAVLGAKSLLTKSVPPFSISFGLPAVHKANRYQEIEYNASYARWFH